MDDELARLREAIEAAPIMMWLAGPDRTRAVHNRAWLAFTGRSVDDEAGEGWLAGVHPDDVTRWRATLASVPAREPWRVGYRLRSAGGEERWVLEHAMPRTAADGALVGYVGACVDVTDARAEASRRVREAEELARIARLVSETLDLGNVAERIAETVLGLLNVQSSAIRLTRADGALAPIALGGLAKTYGESAAVVPAGFGLIGRAAIEGRALWTEDVRRDTRFALTPEMRERNAAAGNVGGLAVPLRVAGRVIGVLSVGARESRVFTEGEIALLQTFADQAALALDNARLYERVTQHAAELEQRVRERTAELEAAQETLVRAERLAVLGQLAGGISHELRNPLGVIRNSIYYLRMVAGPDARVERHLAILEREVLTANRIVGGLLDFARDTPPERTEVDLGALIREYLEQKPVPETVAVALELAEGLPRVLADPNQLVLVLGNLVTNAVQAMAERGQLTITTSAGPDGIWLAVADTGSGIGPEHLGKIFEPLFTTKARGIGLGLSIAKNLVEANGATLAVASEPGRGSCFTLRFPPR